MDFREEFEAYEREHPYREFPVQGGRFRYILSGESGKPAIVFLNGLGMQEAWLRYMIAFEREYRVLMMEYPLACETTDALLDAIDALLRELGIVKPILVGGSDGGLLAQLFVRRFPGNVGALVLMTTVTIDSKYCEDTNRENANRYLAKVRLIPYAILKRVLLRLVKTYFNDESETERAYGTSFLKYIASDPAYKQKYLHAVKLVYDGAKQPKLRTEEFAGLRDRVLILHPEKDIFIKEDQQKLTALLADVGAETKTMRGGHLAFVSSPELYIGAIRGFLNRLQLRKDDDNRWTYDDK